MEYQVYSIILSYNLGIMKKLFYFSLSLFMLISLNSCQKHRMNADLESISGPIWKLTHVEGQRIDRRLYSNGLPSVQFSVDGKFTGSSGCNSYIGSLATMTNVYNEFKCYCCSSTKVACNGIKGNVEEGMFQGFSDSNQLFQKGNSLIFRKDNKELLKFEK